MFLATPGTLIALLRAVAFGWRQERLAESSAEIAQLGRELHQRVGTFAEHLAKVGGAIDRAARSYNDAVGSLESRVLVTTRKLADHGAAPATPLAPPATVDTAVRPLDRGRVGRRPSAARRAGRLSRTRRPTERRKGPIHQGFPGMLDQPTEQSVGWRGAPR